MEVLINGQWGSVCDDSWNEDNAAVVCKQLGLNGPAEAFSGAFFGEGNGPVWLDDVQCDGSEASLLDCSNSGIGQSNCDHAKDAGVRCSGKLRNILY